MLAISFLVLEDMKTKKVYKFLTFLCIWSVSQKKLFKTLPAFAFALRFLLFGVLECVDDYVVLNYSLFSPFYHLLFRMQIS